MMFQQGLIFSFIGQLADTPAIRIQKAMPMKRLFSHIPQNHSAIGVHCTFHDFTWKITGETEKGLCAIKGLTFV